MTSKEHRRFINALRGMLGLEPLYNKEAWRKRKELHNHISVCYPSWVMIEMSTAPGGMREQGE